MYEADDPELSRRVALKLVRPEGSAVRASELRARLLREAQAMARLAHPNVIAVYDAGSLGDRVFVAMELVRGGTLGAWLREAPRSEAAILEVLAQAGRGLAAAHGAGLIHRDFKPDNVLVGADGRARVTDFGLAKGIAFAEDEGESASREGESASREGESASREGESASREGESASREGESASREGESASREGEPIERRRESASITRTGALVGTPAYMAPEQIAGKKADARADVYAFSVASFEALTGERPFPARSIEELREAIEKGAIHPTPRKIRPEVMSALRRGLAARPEDRWPSMDALLSALAPKRRSSGWIAVGIAAVAALGVAGIALARGGDERPCRGAADAWGEAWDEAAKGRVRAAFERTGAAFAGRAFAGVDEALEGRKRAWIAMSTEACEATRIARTQSEALLDRRTACLASRKGETAALVRLFEAADAGLVERAALATGALSPLADCANARALGEAPILSPDEARSARAAEEGIASARALRAAGQYARGLDVAGEAVKQARASGDSRLLATALVVEARCREEEMQYPLAEATYHAAVRAALAAHDDASAADAWTQLGGIAGYRRESSEEAHLWLSYADAAIDNLGDDRARRARFFSWRALVEWSIDADLEQADLDYARERALLEGLSADQAERFRGTNGLVLFDMGLYDRALAVFEESARRTEREKGRDHPEMLEELENVAEVLALLGRPKEAIPMYRDLLARFPARAAGYTNHRLAEALRLAGDPRGALEEDERALAAQSNEPPEALTQAAPLTGKGLDLWMLGRPKEAVAPLERARAIRRKAKLAPLRAQTDFALARALLDAGQDRARAVVLAEGAEEAYAEAARRYGSRWYADEAKRIAAWLGVVKGSP